MLRPQIAIITEKATISMTRVTAVKEFGCQESRWNRFVSEQTYRSCLRNMLDHFRHGISVASNYYIQLVS